MQVYIVSGGWGGSYLESTETLEKDRGSAWQVVASLPSARYGASGLGLDRGRFLVTGQSAVKYNMYRFNLVKRAIFQNSDSTYL